MIKNGAVALSDGPFSYFHAGLYKVVEKKREDSTVTYDTKTYQITVSLTDDGEGTINVTTDPEKNPYDFTNYNTKGDITFSGKKTIENKTL